MSYMKLYSDGAKSVTEISNCFIDEYMTKANGEYVKIYLYLVRCMGDASLNYTVSDLADRFDHTESDIIRALKYWDREGVIRLDYDSANRLSGVELLPLGKSTPKVEKAPSNIVPVEVNNAPARHEYTNGEIDAFRKDPIVSELFYVIESYVCKPMTVSEIQTVLYWYEELEFSSDIIDYLVEYCVNKGHKSFRYMDRIALDWHENGLYTIESVKTEADKHNKLNYSIIKALGISGRDLAQSEKAYAQKWAGEWGFSVELIEEACKRTIDVTHQASFPYTDKILDTWHQNKITDLNGVKQLDEAFSRKHKVQIDSPSPRKSVRRNFDERKYDYDQLEQELIKIPVQ